MEGSRLRIKFFCILFERNNEISSLKQKISDVRSSPSDLNANVMNDYCLNKESLFDMTLDNVLSIENNEYHDKINELIESLNYEVNEASTIIDKPVEIEVPVNAKFNMMIEQHKSNAVSAVPPPPTDDSDPQSVPTPFAYCDD